MLCAVAWNTGYQCVLEVIYQKSQKVNLVFGKHRNL